MKHYMQNLLLNFMMILALQTSINCINIIKAGTWAILTKFKKDRCFKTIWMNLPQPYNHLTGIKTLSDLSIFT